MPRPSSFWNNLPITVHPNDEANNGYRILEAWGVTSFGKRNLPSDKCDYAGWQRIHLPDGWMISLEGPNFLLLDEHDQIRGEILNALPPPTGDRAQQPWLALRTAIRFKDSFTLGHTYSAWAENALGEQLYGIFDELVPEEEADDRVPEIENMVLDWLHQHYPNWRSFEAYWDDFVRDDQPMALGPSDVAALAAALLDGKNAAAARALLNEMGTGVKRTEFILDLQKQLEALSRPMTVHCPFQIALNVTYRLEQEIDRLIGPDRFVHDQ